jgi:hypothetical protein
MDKDYNQLELDTTLERDRNLKENIQTVITFEYGQIMDSQPDKVANHHEGYGILAEEYSLLAQKMKIVSGDMQTILKLLPNGEADILNIVGSLYNSAAETATMAVELAAQSRRIMNDLYYGDDKSPIEKYLEEQEAEGFEDAEENPDGDDGADEEADDELPVEDSEQ